MSRADEYLFGHSNAEADRLTRQAIILQRSSLELFRAAGLSRGTKVLEVGSGVGDVTLLLADLVGPTGSVTCVEQNERFAQIARARLAGVGHRNVVVLNADLNEFCVDQSFDAVVGRCILFFMEDPARVVARLASHVRPGGIVAFQEPGNATHTPVSLPPSALLDQMWAWIMETYRRAGIDRYFGLSLFRIFLDAHLQAPTMHFDAAVGGGPEWPGYEDMAGLVRVLLPQIVKLGVATERQVEIETLATRLRDEVVSQRGVVSSWGFVSAFVNKE